MAERHRDRAEKQLGVLLRVPLSVRLDRLLQRSADGGERTSRKEIVAALVYGCALPPAEVHRVVRQSRTATMADAVLLGDDFTRYMAPTRRPGPRRPSLLYSEELETATPGLNSATPLTDLPRVRVGLAVPDRMDRRLDVLVGHVENDNGATDRSEVLSALILAAPDDPERLVELVRNYRNAQRGWRRTSRHGRGR